MELREPALGVLRADLLFVHPVPLFEVKYLDLDARAYKTIFLTSRK
jgi:hypothetical protein